MPETVLTQRSNTAAGNSKDINIGRYVLISSFLDCKLLWGKSCLFFRVVLSVVPSKHQEMPAHDKSLAVGNGIQQTHMAGCCNVQRWARRNNKTADSQLACSSAASAGILEKHRVHS